MRKFFLGLMLSSALGAVVIGGALAWTGSADGSSSAQAGKIAVSIYNYNTSVGSKVVPTGNAIKVATGGISNTGDIAVHVTGGTVTYTGNPICHVSGSVGDVNNVTVNTNTSVPGLYNVYLTMGPGADDACQNYTLPYNVSINVAS